FLKLEDRVGDFFPREVVLAQHGNSLFHLLWCGIASPCNDKLIVVNLAAVDVECALAYRKRGEKADSTPLVHEIKGLFLRSGVRSCDNSDVCPHATSL